MTTQALSKRPGCPNKAFSPEGYCQRHAETSTSNSLYRNVKCNCPNCDEYAKSNNKCRYHAIMEADLKKRIAKLKAFRALGMRRRGDKSFEQRLLRSISKPAKILGLTEAR